MSEFLEEDIRANLEKPKKVMVSSNALSYGNTVLQMSNISWVTVHKQKHVKKDVMPTFILLLWLFLGAFVFVSAIAPEARIIGVLMVVIGLFAYLNSLVERVKYTYFLVIELNSQTRKFFPFTSEDFLNRVFFGLQYMIENPHGATGFVANFESQKIEYAVDHALHDPLVLVDVDTAQSAISAPAARNLFSP